MPNDIAMLKKEECTGCGACAQCCPRGCIGMVKDGEGFLIPDIDGDKCKNCGRCLSVCPQKNPVPGHLPKAVYAAYANDDIARANSSSGGLFSAAARHVLENGGAVCAVTLEGDLARFLVIDKPQALSSLRGSKYVQAQTGDVFIKVKERLLKGQEVLFAGCPCQVAALKNFLGKPFSGLFTTDIICHGVPSPLLFQVYIKWLEEKARGKVSAYTFRSKARGWGMTLSYNKSGKRVSRISIFDRYNANFLNCNTYRESCYQCPYASKQRQGDWTIGDYWGILKEHPAFYSEKGVSVLLVNTDKGQAMLENTASGITMLPSTFEQVARHNMNLKSPSKRPAKRDTIYRGIGEMAPSAYVNKRLTLNNGLKQTIKALIPWQVKRLYKRSVPF